VLGWSVAYSTTSSFFRKLYVKAAALINHFAISRPLVIILNLTVVKNLIASSLYD
jgi:hypothetical protein